MLRSVRKGHRRGASGGDQATDQSDVPRPAQIGERACEEMADDIGQRKSREQRRQRIMPKGSASQVKGGSQVLPAEIVSRIHQPAGGEGGRAPVGVTLRRIAHQGASE